MPPKKSTFKSILTRCVFFFFSPKFFSKSVFSKLTFISPRSQCITVVANKLQLVSPRLFIREQTVFHVFDVIESCIDLHTDRGTCNKNGIVPALKLIQLIRVKQQAHAPVNNRRTRGRETIRLRQYRPIQSMIILELQPKKIKLINIVHFIFLFISMPFSCIC